MSDTPTILLVATYRDVEAAEADFQALMDSHLDGDIGHLAAAVVERRPDGTLRVHRHNSATRHLAMGGALAGSVLALLAPPVGIPLLSGVIGIGGGLAGAGAIVGHFWHGLPRQDLRELGDLLEAGQASLVAVAIDKQQAALDTALNRAETRISKVIERGDVEAAFDAAVMQATHAHA